MKKSKIIVPAVALLALGMAASVTGTVAWFTTNRSVSAATLSVAIAGSQDLRISDSLAPSYSWTNELTWSKADVNMVPSTPVAGTLAATTALFADANNAACSADPTFIRPNASNVVSADNGTAATAAIVGDNSAKYELAGERGYLVEDYALKYEGSKKVGDEVVTQETVHGKINITAGAGKNIDLALRVGIYNVTTSKITVYNVGDSVGTSYVVRPSDLTLESGVAQDLKMFVWYEGTDARCKNANAITNTLNITVAWSLDTIA